MQNLISFVGMLVLIFLAWCLSEDRRRFPWRVVIWGLSLQMVFGFLVLSFEPGAQFFLKLNDLFNALLSFSREGAIFVFNSLGSAEVGPGATSLKDYLTRLGSQSTDPVVQAAVKNGTVPGFFFAFQVLATIIFFSALLSVLYYLGIMQKIVLLCARVMAHTMGVSGAESLSNAANIFVGQTEAPLVVRPYIDKMTRSEIMAIMVGRLLEHRGRSPGRLRAHAGRLLSQHRLPPHHRLGPLRARRLHHRQDHGSGARHPLDARRGQDGRPHRGREHHRRRRQRHHRGLAARHQRGRDARVLLRPRGHGQLGGGLVRGLLP